MRKMRDRLLIGVCVLAFAAAVGHLAGLIFGMVASAVSLSTYGADAARDALIPWISMGIFSIGALALLAALPWFRTLRRS